MAEEKQEFVREFMEFYKEFIQGSAGSIETLADLQENFPNQYEVFQEVHEDPMGLLDTDKLSEEEKDTLLTIVMRASSLGQRTQKVFDTSADEKRELSKDLEKFGDFVDEKLEDMMEEGEENEK